MLAGRPEVIQVDPTVPGPDGMKIIDPGTPGQDIRTTIDASLQLQVEQEVFAAWIADKAKTVSAVVMDPKTGELLAEASYPSYDANDYAQVADTDPGLFNDPVVHAGLRTGLGLQDAHGLGRPADQDDGADDRDRRLRRPQAGGRPGGRRRGPQGQGLADLRPTWWPSPATSARPQVAFRLGKTTAGRLPGALPDLAEATASARRRGSTSPARCRASSATRRSTPWAPDRPRQRLLRPGRRGDAHPGRARLRRDGQRRHAGDAARRPARHPRSARPRRPRPSLQSGTQVDQRRASRRA